MGPGPPGALRCARSPPIGRKCFLSSPLTGSISGGGGVAGNGETELGGATGPGELPSSTVNRQYI